ncbi:glycosyltransferase [Mesobacillus foraminis]|uniref:glycosyltransferase n=1 Tax=Mesobacillus foraminis TaxID=279826 RepID=UPI000EF4EB77|nr:glycosyltransferase [Mesobacillus foraminis]
MIFVTVGTHEQQFDRVIKKVDDLIREKKIMDQVFMQIGYSTYLPKNCDYKKLIGYDEMVKYVEMSQIVITHGGPGSIMMPLSLGKIPIVVPRQKSYNEHVDDHQVLFSNRLAKGNKIITVLDIDCLEYEIMNYNSLVKNKYQEEINKENTNLKSFIEKMDNLTDRFSRGFK